MNITIRAVDEGAGELIATEVSLFEAMSLLDAWRAGDVSLALGGTVIPASHLEDAVFGVDGLEIIVNRGGRT